MQIVLPVVVFISGAVVMVLELAASRIIAPYLGTSVIVWTSLIGVILAALSIGNWIGGRIADRYPAPQTLAAMLLAGSLLIAVSSQFRWFLSTISSQMELQTAAIFGVFVLFGPATIALGTIAPLAVKLALADFKKTGRIVGKLYALSNAGSIIGTFLGGFILISFLGSGRILTLLSITLALLAVLVFIANRAWPSRWAWAVLPLIGAALIPVSGPIILAEGETLLADVDTRYSRTWIVDQQLGGATVRSLRNSVRGYQSAMAIEYPGELLLPYTRMFESFKAFKPDAKDALMIGGSAYIYPQHFLFEDPSRRVTVVEIDPGLTQLAKTYFGLKDDARLTIQYEDGRTYLNRSNAQHDLIVMDAFNSGIAIPFQLTTLEAVQRLAGNLADDGIVMVNIISPLKGERNGFLAAEYATYREVFSSVNLYQVDPEDPETDQNVILIASRKPLVPRANSPYAKELSQKEWQEALPAFPVLTDDFSPVERYAITL